MKHVSSLCTEWVAGVAVALAILVIAPLIGGGALSARVMDSMRGGNKMTQKSTIDCNTSNFGTECLHVVDGGGCNACTSSNSASYLQMGVSNGWKYGTGPPEGCGDITTGTCQNQICSGPFQDTGFECNNLPDPVEPQS